MWIFVKHIRHGVGKREPGLLGLRMSVSSLCWARNPSSVDNVLPHTPALHRLHISSNFSYVFIMCYPNICTDLTFDPKKGLAVGRKLGLNTQWHLIKLKYKLIPSIQRKVTCIYCILSIWQVILSEQHDEGDLPLIDGEPESESELKINNWPTVTHPLSQRTSILTWVHTILKVKF